MKRGLLLIACAISLAAGQLAAASMTEGTVLPSARYAWGENLGWLDLAPEEGGLIITDTAVSGYAWSRQYGWINFRPASSGQGVVNTANGALSGSAWISGRGWLDLSGVTIDTGGRFRGVAGTTGSQVGRITFDCQQCEVRTDWRPLSERPVSSPPGNPGSRTPSAVTPPEIPLPVEITPTVEPEIEAIVPEEESPIDPPLRPRPPRLAASPKGGQDAVNRSLTLEPDQSGSLTRDLPDGPVRINVFPGSAETQFTIDIRPVAIDLHGFDPRIKPLGDFFFQVQAIDIKGLPLHSFRAPLKLTLPLANWPAGTAPSVYRFDEASGAWWRIAPAAFNDQHVIFYTEQIGRFAILDAPGRPDRIDPLSVPLAQRAILPLAVAGTALIAAAYVSSTAGFRWR